jgi:hypothetical protein
MTLSMVKINPREVRSMNEHHDFSLLGRSRTLRFQKGADNLNLTVGAGTVEAEFLTRDVRGERTDGVRARETGAVVEAPGRDPECMLLWDVGGRYGSSRLPVPPVAKMTLAYEVWEQELGDDYNKTFLLNGVKFGFMILDRECTLTNIDRRNYKSCHEVNAVLAEKQIQKEVDQGRYIVCSEPPLVVSSIGAIPKNEEAVRMIHDLSRPDGGVNSFSVDSSVRYSTLEDAILLIKPNSYLAKIDLSEAYRHVPIHPYC